MNPSFLLKAVVSFFIHCLKCLFFSCLFFSSVSIISFPIFDLSFPFVGMLSFGLANAGRRFSFLHVSRKARSNLILNFFVMDYSNWRHCRAVSFPCFSRILLKMFREMSLKMKVKTRSCEGCMVLFPRYFDHHCDRRQDNYTTLNTIKKNPLSLTEIKSNQKVEVYNSVVVHLKLG